MQHIAVCPQCGRAFGAQEWELLRESWSAYVPATVSDLARWYDARSCWCGTEITVDRFRLGLDRPAA
jgi:hypothetical protein